MLALSSEVLNSLLLWRSVGIPNWGFFTQGSHIFPKLFAFWLWLWQLILLHPVVVNDYLKVEIANHRIAYRPFKIINPVVRLKSAHS